jgi:hypothetical protein
MQQQDILDKKILQLTNGGAKYYSDTKSDFYIDILEPIKNVTHVKILKSSIRLNLTSLNGTTVVDNDPIYVSINDYNRIATINNKIVNTSNYITDVFNSFEVINLNVTSKYLIMANTQISNFLQINGILFENIYTSTSSDFNDTSVYNVIPHDPSLLRFNIKLYDKYYNLINKDDIISFEILICVFSNNKKVTMR